MSIQPRPGYGFPEAPKEKTDQPCLIVPNDRIVEFYNAVTGAKRDLRNVNKAAKAWFTAAAKDRGWTQVKWYLEHDRPRGLAALLVYKYQESSE